MVGYTLWRAADDDVVMQGTAFAETEEIARAYLGGANPGFGGDYLYYTNIQPLGSQVLDWRGKSTRSLARKLGLSDPGAIGVDEWVPRSPSACDALAALGYLWLIVDESYPEGTSTWLWLGDSSVLEPELTRKSAGFRFGTWLRQAMPMWTELPPGWYLEEDEDSIAQQAALKKGDGRISYVVMDDQGYQKGSISAMQQGGGQAASRWFVSYVEVETDASGLGPYLYEKILDRVSDLGGTLESDNSVSDSAARVWMKYHERAQQPDSDIAMIPRPGDMPYRNSLQEVRPGSREDENETQDEILRLLEAPSPSEKHTHPGLAHMYRKVRPAVERSAALERPEGPRTAALLQPPPAMVRDGLSALRRFPVALRLDEIEDRLYMLEAKVQRGLKQGRGSKIQEAKEELRLLKAEKAELEAKADVSDLEIVMGPDGYRRTEIVMPTDLAGWKYLDAIDEGLIPEAYTLRLEEKPNQEAKGLIMAQEWADLDLDLVIIYAATDLHDSLIALEHELMHLASLWLAKGKGEEAGSAMLGRHGPYSAEDIGQDAVDIEVSEERPVEYETNILNAIQSTVRYFLSSPRYRSIRELALKFTQSANAEPWNKERYRLAEEARAKYFQVVSECINEDYQNQHVNLRPGLQGIGAEAWDEHTRVREEQKEYAMGVRSRLRLPDLKPLVLRVGSWMQIKEHKTDSEPTSRAQQVMEPHETRDINEDAALEMTATEDMSHERTEYMGVDSPGTYEHYFPTETIESQDGEPRWDERDDFVPDYGHQSELVHGVNSAEDAANVDAYGGMNGLQRLTTASKRSIAFDRSAMPMPTKADMPAGWRVVENWRYPSWSAPTDKATRADFTLLNEQPRSPGESEVEIATLSIGREHPGLDTWHVTESYTKRSGWGVYLYEFAFEKLAQFGWYLASDENVSDEAARVWDKYHERAQAGELEHVPYKRRVDRYVPGVGTSAQGDLFADTAPRSEVSLQHKYRRPPKKASLTRQAMPMPTQLPQGWEAKIEASADKVHVFFYSPEALEDAKEGYAKLSHDVIVWAERTAPDTFTVRWSHATKRGQKEKLGAFAYETLLNQLAPTGAWLEPDTSVTDAAASVWAKYFLRSDIEKVKGDKRKITHGDKSPNRRGDPVYRKDEYLLYKYRKKTGKSAGWTRNAGKELVKAWITPEGQEIRVPAQMSHADWAEVNIDFTSDELEQAETIVDALQRRGWIRVHGDSFHLAGVPPASMVVVQSVVNDIASRMEPGEFIHFGVGPRGYSVQVPFRGSVDLSKALGKSQDRTASSNITLPKGTYIESFGMWETYKNGAKRVDIFDPDTLRPSQWPQGYSPAGIPIGSLVLYLKKTRGDRRLAELSADLFADHRATTHSAEAYVRGKGYGQLLYRWLMDWMRDQEGWVRPDPRAVSESASKAWHKLYQDPSISKRRLQDTYESGQGPRVNEGAETTSQYPRWDRAHHPHMFQEYRSASVEEQELNKQAEGNSGLMDLGSELKDPTPLDTSDMTEAEEDSADKEDFDLRLGTSTQTLPKPQGSRTILR